MMYTFFLTLDHKANPRRDWAITALPRALAEPRTFIATDRCMLEAAWKICMQLHNV